MTNCRLLEELQLELQFGDGYREYCRHVGRFIPRVKPWNPAPTESGG